MQITITDQQKQQIMQTPEFVAKLSELMKDYAPKIPEKPKFWVEVSNAIFQSTSFANIKFKPADYIIFLSMNLEKWDGIMWQKWCMIAQTFTPKDLLLSGDLLKYADLMTFAQNILAQIDAEIEIQRKKAIEAVWLAHSAKGKIIHS